MKPANDNEGPKNLARRGSMWWFTKRVPARFLNVVGRTVIRLSTRVRCADDHNGTEAAKRAAQINRDLLSQWRLLASRDNQLQFTKGQIERLPRIAIVKSVGVYFLFDGATCVYVGQSTNVHNRVHQHMTRKGIIKKFDTYAWVACSRDDLQTLERMYINLMQPTLNGGNHAAVNDNYPAAVAV